MSFTRAASLLALGLVCASAHATDFGQVMEVARATWPTKTRIAVVANYARSRAEVQDLAWAAGADAVIVVLDVREVPDEARRVIYQVANRIHPDYLVLLREDPTYPEGVLPSTVLVRQLVQAGIPCLGTTSAAIRQGATFAMGPETGGELLVNPEVKGSINFTMPPARVSSLGPARVQVASLRQ